MKKKLKKRLYLNKTTLVNLDQDYKKKIKGGTTIFELTCYCNTEHKSCSLGGNCCPPPEGNFAQSFDC